MTRTRMTLAALPAALLLAAASYANDTSNQGPDLGHEAPEPPIPDACDGDFDGNGMINFGDMLHVLSHWGRPVTGSSAEERIGFAHLLEVVNGFGEPCS